MSPGALLPGYTCDKQPCEAVCRFDVGANQGAFAGPTGTATDTIPQCMQDCILPVSVGAAETSCSAVLNGPGAPNPTSVANGWYCTWSAASTHTCASAGVPLDRNNVVVRRS
eukprot:gene10150-biopygen5201